MNRLADSSTDTIDYRSRLIYVNMRLKHKNWDPTIIRAIAVQRATFVTIFQQPLEWFGRGLMKVRLIFAQIFIKTKKK